MSYLDFKGWTERAWISLGRAEIGVPHIFLYLYKYFFVRRPPRTRTCYALFCGYSRAKPKRKVPRLKMLYVHSLQYPLYIVIALLPFWPLVGRALSQGSSPSANNLVLFALRYPASFHFWQTLNAFVRCRWNGPLPSPVGGSFYKNVGREGFSGWRADDQHGMGTVLPHVGQLRG